MILALLLQATVPSLGALPQQSLPGKGCAAYLWSVADRRFVAMASAEPAFLRILLDGTTVDLPRASASGGSTVRACPAATWRTALPQRARTRARSWPAGA